MIQEIQILKYIKKLPDGSIFSLKQLLFYTNISEEIIQYILNQLIKTNTIVILMNEIYFKPKISRFGQILVEPGKVACFIAQELGAIIYPSGACTANTLGFSTQCCMNYSYVSSKHIDSFKVNNANVNFQYLSELEAMESKLNSLDAKEKELIMLLWLSLEYLSKDEVYSVKAKIVTYISMLSLEGRVKFEQILCGDLSWIKELI